MIAKFENHMPHTIHTYIRKYKNLNNLLHWHMEHELIFVERGSVELNVNNNLYTLNKGMYAFIKGGDIHYIKGNKDSITYVIKTSVPEILGITETKNLECPIIKNTIYIENDFSRIRKELKNSDKYYNIIADSIAVCIVANIFRTEKTYNADSLIRPNEKQKKLLNWISNNYNSISFEDAAKYMGFSEAYFSKYFQNLMGMKFTKYLNILKVSAAIEMLSNKENSMSEISLSCGFGTTRSFNRTFKELTGYTPKSLPAGYIFQYTIINSNNINFDPTLDCSEIVE